MYDLFISYSKEDRDVASRLAETLQEESWRVFWDRKIEAGAEWNDEILRNLRQARCVIVLWSKSSRKSLWVRGEAADAYDRDAYLPFCIDDTRTPKLFERKQTASLKAWAVNGDEVELSHLKDLVRSRVDPLPMFGNLEPVLEGKPVTEAHLHLIHSCWRVDKESPFGRMPYEIQLIVYGHESALRRVEAVDYHFPGYPPNHEHQRIDPSKPLFEVKELANGFSIVQAHVHIARQPRGASKTITLSRFVNMTESGPRLLDQYRRNSTGT